MNIIRWDKLNCRLIWAYEGVVSDNGNRTGFIDNKYSIWFIKSGKVYLSGRSFKSCTADNGMWVYAPIKSERDQRFDEGTEILSISFLAEWPNGLPLFPITDPVIFSKSINHGLMNSVRSLIIDGEKHIDLFSMRNEAGVLRLEKYIDIQRSFWTFIKEWTQTLIKSGLQPSPFPFIDSRASAIAEIIDALPFTGRIPYHYIAEKICLSRVHIDRLFLRATGKTPKEYMENNIVRKAEELLLGSGDSVKQIAAVLGFSTPSHFCAWFKRLCGIYPNEYRKR